MFARIVIGILFLVVSLVFAPWLTILVLLVGVLRFAWWLVAGK